MALPVYLDQIRIKREILVGYISFQFQFVSICKGLGARKL